MPTLDKNSTVAQWVAQYPQTAPLFEQFQIDYCCHGAVALGEACDKTQLDVNRVIAQLTEAVAHSREEVTKNWLESPLNELCDHIQETHHAYLRQELPRLTELIDKVVTAHAANHPELGELKQVYASLRAELEPHLLKEEQILFPAIRQLEDVATLPSFPFGTVANPIRMMENEHVAAGDALLQIRKLANDFLPPDGACNTYRVMLDALQSLERDLHQHIHKENYILFPKSQQLEKSLA